MSKSTLRCRLFSSVRNPLFVVYFLVTRISTNAYGGVYMVVTGGQGCLNHLGWRHNDMKMVMVDYKFVLHENVSWKELLNRTKYLVPHL